MLNKINNLMKRKRGQSLSEYAILMAIIIAAVVSMQGFVRRRAQAVIYDTIREFGDPDFTDEYNVTLGMGSEQAGTFNILTNSTLGRLSSGAGTEQRSITEETSRTGMTRSKEILRKIGQTSGGGGGGSGGGKDTTTMEMSAP